MNNVLLATYPFSSSGLNTLEGIDFWAGDTANPRSFFVDDVQAINTTTDKA